MKNILLDTCLTLFGVGVTCSVVYEVLSAIPGLTGWVIGHKMTAEVITRVNNNSLEKWQAQAQASGDYQRAQFIGGVINQR